MTIWARWAVEMIGIISTFVGTDILAAQTVLKGISVSFFNIPMGLSTSSVILVGSNIA
jgi:Na+-driven multidrug efflux pump